MSTRTAKNPASFHQHSFASSPEFERGLLGNLVARRAALLDRREDREQVWTLQCLSHQPGGLAAVASELIAGHPDKIKTLAMSMLGVRRGKICDASQVKAIRANFPFQWRKGFLLKGEYNTNCIEPGEIKDQAANAELAREALMSLHGDGGSEKSLSLPSSYPADKFFATCHAAASENLTAYLYELCLNPEIQLESAPWYFPDLFTALREHVSQWSAKKTNYPETKLGRIIADEFDYTWQSRCMSLLTGEARRGKSFAAKICCAKHPGRARFVEVPPGNDDTSFFRALARGLGLGNLGQYSTVDVRDRVETMLLTGDILLVLDESQRLFPERTRYSYPCRITWLMTMANAKVPILMISTPQFTDRQKIAEKGGWNSAQLTGRIFNYKELPATLDDADLMAVCQAALPEADKKVLIVLATYARASARYLSAIESITLRARYLAGRAGRQLCSTDDVRTAMDESVVPSDTALNSVLEKARAQSPRARLPHLARQNIEPPAENPQGRPDRSEASAGRRENLTEFTHA